MAKSIEQLIKAYKKAPEENRGLLLDEFTNIIDPSIKAYTEVTIDDPEMDRDAFKKAKKTQQLLKRATKDIGLQNLFIDAGYEISDITGIDEDLGPLAGVPESIQKKYRKREKELETEAAKELKKIRSQKTTGKQLKILDAPGKAELDDLDIKAAGLPLITPEKDTLESLYKKYETQAQSLTAEENDKLQIAIRDAIIFNNIPEEQANNILIELNKLHPDIESSQNYKLSYLKTRKKDDQDFKNRHDIVGIRSQLYDAIKEREVSRLRKFYSRAEMKPTDAFIEGAARKTAYNMILPYRFYTTSEFRDKLKPSFQSSIRDIERGLIFDDKTNKYRKATTFELFLESLKKQRLDTNQAGDLDRASEVIRLYEDQVKTFGEPTLITPEGIPFEEKLEKEIADAGLLPAYNKAINKYKQRDLSVLKEIDPDSYKKIKDIEFKLQRDPKPVSKGVLTTPKRVVTTELERPYTEEGGVYETEFARALRIAFGIPSAVLSASLTSSPVQALPIASAYSKITGKPFAIDKSKLKTYKVERPIYDTSGNPTGKTELVIANDPVRQAIINLATAQGLPEAFRAIKPLTDVIGEGGAFGLGMAAELPLPMTGIPTAAKVATKSVQLGGGLIDALGKTARLSPLAATGRAVRALATPLESLKSKQIVKEVDEIFKGNGKEAVKRLNSTWSFKDDLYNLFNKEVRRNNLSEISANIISENIAAPIILQKFFKQKGPDFDEFLQLYGKNKYADKLIDETNRIPKLTDKINYIKQELDKKVSDINKAASRSPEVNLAVQKANNAANIIANRSRVSKQLNNDQFVKEITLLNSDIVNESFKIALASKIENGIIKEDALAKIANDFAKLPANERSQENLAKIIDVNAFDFVPLNLTQNIMATTNAINNRIYRDILNKTPLNDMVLMGTITGVPKANLTDANRQKFIQEYKKTLGNNITPTIVNKELFYNIKSKDRLTSALVEQVDPNIIRSSEWWLDAFKAIDEGKVSIDQLSVFKNVITDKLAEKHFNGIPLREYGEQFQRAAVPDPLRDSLVPSTFRLKSNEDIPGYTKSSLMQDAKDIARVLPFVKNLKWVKPKPTSSAIPSELKIAIDDINNMTPKIYDDFVAEVQQNTKKFDDPNIGLNQSFNDTWKSIEDSEINRIQSIVDRNFDGDFKKYVNTILTAIDKERDLSVAQQIKAKANVIRTKKGREPTNDEWKSIVLNYEPYLIKRDIWDKLIKSYYRDNPAALKKIQDVRYIDIFTKVKYTPKQQRFTDEAASRASTNSNTYTPNASTFKVVIDRLKNADEVFRSNELKINNKNAYAFPLMAWAMQTRQANKAKEIIDNYASQNPDKLLRLIQDPMQIKLSEQYIEPIENQYKSLLKDTGLNEEEIEKISQAMSLQHIKSINAISNKDKLDAIKELESGVYTAEGKPLYGNTTLRSRLRRIVQKQNNALRKVFKNQLEKADTELKPEIINRLLINAEKNFLGANAPLQSNMVDAAFSNLFNNYQEILRGSGAISGHAAPTSLSQYRPQLMKIPNRDAALTYGNDFVSTVNKLEDQLAYGKFDAYFDDLTRDYMEGFISDVVDNTRRLTSNGLLGGAWAPGSRNIGMNIASLPFIMMSTVGNLGLKTSLKIVSDRATDPFKLFTGKVANVGKLNEIPDDAVAFTDNLGRKYTAAEVRHLMSKYNTGFSRESVVLGSRKTSQMLRDMKVYADGTKANPKTNFLNRYLHPAKDNIYQKLNMAVDQYVRDQTFITALKGGYTPQQAATLARRSALDYGQINPKLKNSLARYTMFVSFRIESIKETMNLLYKAIKNDKPNALISILRMNQARMREAEAWYFTDDDFKQRFALSLTPTKIRDQDILSGGPRIPALESSKALIDAMSSVSAAVIGEGSVGEIPNELSKLALDAQYKPSLDYLISIVKNNLSEGRKGSKVPDAWINALRQNTLSVGGIPMNGIDLLLEKNLIRPIDVERRDILSPTYDVTDGSIQSTEVPGAIQFEYNGKKAQSEVERLYLGTLLLGVNRLIKEASTLQMITGGGREAYPQLTVGTQYGKYDAINPILYALGLATPKERNAIMNRYDRKAKGYYRDLLKKIESQK